MATGTLTAPPKTIAEYVRAICESEPAIALEIVLAETDRQKHALQRVQEELRLRLDKANSLAEVEMDASGRFVAKSLASLMAIGAMYAESGMVPKHYAGKPGACAIAEQMARRCGVDTFLFMQNTYEIGNKIGMEAKLAIALLNSSGRIKGRIQWKLEGAGESRKCTASVIDAATGETISETVTWAMVEAEGWASKSGSKWKTMPEVMFKYRSAAFLVNIHYPDVKMGMYTVEELEDSIVDSRFDDPSPRTLDALTERLESRSTVDAKALDEVANHAASTQAGETAKPDLMPGETAGGELPNAFAGLQEKLDAAETLSDVNDIQGDVVEKYSLNAEEGVRLNTLCDAARQRIRDSRGSKSNK